MRQAARLSPEAEHTVWWLLLCRAVARAARADEREAMIARLEQRMAQCDNAAGVLNTRLMGVLRHEAAMNVEWLRARGEAKGGER